MGHYACKSLSPTQQQRVVEWCYVATINLRGAWFWCVPNDRCHEPKSVRVWSAKACHQGRYMSGYICSHDATHLSQSGWRHKLLLLKLSQVMIITLWMSPCKERRLANDAALLWSSNQPIEIMDWHCLHTRHRVSLGGFLIPYLLNLPFFSHSSSSNTRILSGIWRGRAVEEWTFKRHVLRWDWTTKLFVK